MTWYDFYKNRTNRIYFNYMRKRYEPFIKEIKKTIKSGMVIFEAGAGTGNISKILFQEVKKTCTFIVSDNDFGMLKLMTNNLKDTKIAIKRHDCLLKSKKWYDVIHSHGVLEHFKDTEIKKIINNQLLKSNALIHYVPSNKYKTKSFGDERLLSIDKWKKLINPDEIIEFNEGYDLVLKWGII